MYNLKYSTSCLAPFLSVPYGAGSTVVKFILLN